MFRLIQRGNKGKKPLGPRGKAYFCCWDSAGYEPCQGWKGCGSGHSEAPRARGEARGLSFRNDWDETKEGERPTASPKRWRGGEKCEAGGVYRRKRGEDDPAGGEVGNLQTISADEHLHLSVYWVND